MELTILEKHWSMQILAYLLAKGATRFKDLSKVCPREATLTMRLRELENQGLIETEAVKTGKERFFAYKLTEKGVKIAQKIVEIKKL